MGWLDFISKMVTALAWPVAAVSVILLLRPEIKAALGLLSKLKVAGMEVEFSRQLEQVRAEASVELANPSTTVLGEFPSFIDRQLGSLAEQSPRAAVMEAWRHVEAAALVAAKNFDKGDEFRARTMTFRAIQIIERAGIIPDTIIDIMRRLRSLRNDAAHAAEFTLSPASAIEYIQLAGQVVAYLQGISQGVPEAATTRSKDKHPSAKAAI